MVALVLSMIWRQIAGVNELVRTEGLLWATPQRIRQQAVSERLRTLPAELFLRLLLAILHQGNGLCRRPLLAAGMLPIEQREDNLGAVGVYLSSREMQMVDDMSKWK